MYFKNIIIECPTKDVIEVYRDNILLINGDSLLAFQLTDNIKGLMENELKDKINSISITNLLIEEGINVYKDRLRDLIDYIIFDQQNDIVLDQLFLVNLENAYHNAALEIIKEKQRKITKNGGQLFPTEASSTTTPALESYHFAFSNSENGHSYYGKMSLETDTYKVDLEVGDKLDSDTCYEYEAEKKNLSDTGTVLSTTTIVNEITDMSLIDSGSGTFTPSKLKARGYASVVVREKWSRDKYTLHCKEFQSKNMGSLFTTVSADEFDIIITKLVNPHYYNVIPDAG